jgi:hypothetical protein
MFRRRSPTKQINGLATGVTPLRAAASFHFNGLAGDESCNR